MGTPWYVKGKERACHFAEAGVEDHEIIGLLCHEFPAVYVKGQPPRKSDRVKRRLAAAAKVEEWAEELDNARALGRATIRRQLYDHREAEGGAGVSATVAMAREMGASEGMDRDVAKMIKHLRTLPADKLVAEIERWAAAIA